MVLGMVNGWDGVYVCGRCVGAHIWLLGALRALRC